MESLAASQEIVKRKQRGRRFTYPMLEDEATYRLRRLDGKRHEQARSDNRRREERRQGYSVSNRPSWLSAPSGVPTG